jgi:hydroxymethylglutaryl-CoA reductase (NADPH)
MPLGKEEARRFVQRLFAVRTSEQIQKQLAVDESALPQRIQNQARTDADALARRWQRLPTPQVREVLVPSQPEALQVYERHIENLIGELRMPIGVAGPLRVNGLFAKGDFFVPMATTEAALVASYNRGCSTISEAGGSTAVLLAEGVTRTPCFVFARVAEAGKFAVWVTEQEEPLRAVAATTTHHGRLEDIRFTLEGNHLYLHLLFHTGDAAGQNMVTLATQKICEHLAAQAPVKPVQMYVESNMSGDKKASMQSFLGVRGKLVTAEVLVPGKLVAARLRTTARAMVDYWRVSALGGVLSGTVGVQGHYANGIAALFLATGQDVACVSEASVGVTRMEETAAGELYAAVTMPNLIVGTVGGGTSLPTQAACLELMGLAGSGKSAALAEVCAALCLAGELSIIAALSAGHFAAAHDKLARGAKPDAGGAVAHEQP